MHSIKQPAARRRPVSGMIYTLAQIDNELKLDDGPSLGVTVPMSMFGIQQDDDHGRFFHQIPVQDSHMERFPSEISAEIAATEWRYLRTTHEWIPVFQAVVSGEVLRFLDVHCAFDLIMCEYEVQLTWKGHPREMMDHISVENYACNYANGGDGYELVWQRADLRKRGQRC